LEVTQQVEHKLGREESAIRWGPRVIDIDILLIGDEKISEPNLEIPHPRIAERRFVLVPLLEVDPTVADPWGTRYSTFLEELEGDVTLQEPF
jgi:2-amino-4-hydroxy-6-hydroxymethyldihydropteridine diphosphokinase